MRVSYIESDPPYLEILSGISDDMLTCNVRSAQIIKFVTYMSKEGDIVPKALRDNEEYQKGCEEIIEACKLA